MRNAVDHPKQEKGGELHVLNFRLGPEARSVEEPCWALTGYRPNPILVEMGHIEDGLLGVYEELFAGVFECIKGMPQFQLAELPEDQRDPKCPIRLILTLERQFIAQMNASIDAARKP